MVIFYLKKLIRPLIPDRLMARVRMRQHSRHVRSNVDVFVSDRRLAGRWQDSTPDTYRVRLEIPSGERPLGVSLVTDPAHPTPASVQEEALQALSDPWLGAVVAGETDPPRVIDRRRAEPSIGPRLIALRDEVLAEVGAVADATPLPVLVSRIRDSGHPIGLIPLPRTGAPTTRTDRITAPPVLILAVIPMHDIGGGARSTQIALELLRQGHHVVLASLFEAEESVDLGLRFIHPALEQYSLAALDVSSIVDRAAQPGLVLVEAPAPALVDAAIVAKDGGWEVVYDIIDDWSDPSLGGEWFDARTEAKLVDLADRVVASAPDLVDRALRLGRTAQLVPNAVNSELFGVDRPPRPHDLPEGEPLIGYHGSLYGDWFDWDALRRIAESLPTGALVVIGDDKAARPSMPPNVHFLGLKAQTELPAYLQRLDVGLVSFKVSDTTHAVSPLKAYEYLASGVPVAAPPLRSLAGVEGVHVHIDLVEAVRAALKGEAPDREQALRLHSWTGRVADILGSEPNAIEAATATRVLRPPVHWARGQRLVRGALPPAGGTSD